MMIKIIVLAICGILLVVFVRSYQSEYAIYISICITMIIFFAILMQLEDIKEKLSPLDFLFGENGEYLALIFKMVGITYLCEFCGGICKDAGYQAIGTQVEIFGKMTILLSGVPILMALIHTIQGFTL